MTNHFQGFSTLRHIKHMYLYNAEHRCLINKLRIIMSDQLNYNIQVVYFKSNI